MLPKKYKGASRDLVVKKSKSGLGLFTRQAIERKGFVVEYVGEILTAKEADKKAGKYLFETSKNRFIEGSARTNLARYINHSCRPNCEVEVSRGRVYIFAKRGILPGEELFYDYGEEYFNEHIKPFGCRCPKCSPNVQ